MATCVTMQAANYVAVSTKAGHSQYDLPRLNKICMVFIFLIGSCALAFWDYW